MGRIMKDGLKNKFINDNVNNISSNSDDIKNKEKKLSTAESQIDKMFNLEPDQHNQITNDSINNDFLSSDSSMIFSKYNNNNPNKERYIMYYQLVQ